MGPHISLGDGAAAGGLQVLWRDPERALYRRLCTDENAAPHNVLTLRLTQDPPPPASVQRLVHEYELKDHLESAWAVLPLELVRDRERTMLVLEDPGGEPLDRYLGEPMQAGRFLPLAVAIAAALGRMHQHGLVHKDLKPAHLMVLGTSGEVRLTGFGLASRLPRERQPPGPPEFIAGTLAYMAPEQTGRMNRSIDSRSDLYALGIIFYQMLTGVLPFTASDPMEWVHCHIARMPVPPHQRVAEIPCPISHIVTKLLAKTAEDRYQTATGVERDLRRCLVEWQASGRIATFLPGETDAPDRPSVPEKLYGRARDIETLLTAFDRVAASGRPSLVLVSGYSGIGKSAVVNELHRALVPSRALFASGKSDQYKRDIPYATLAQAFQNLIRPLLANSEAELHHWRQTLGETLGPNGQLILNLVPELKLIVGEQPTVPTLPPQDAQARFQLLLRRFIGVFARPEHPLALFLDDLQWLDLTTLDLLVDLLRQPDLEYLMLVGAYRANEVQPSHPLKSKIEAIRHAGATIHEITLTPLTGDDLATLIADTLHSPPERITPLADLIHAKSGGNPFFAIQFISALFDEALLTFDHSRGEWSWDLSRIRAKGYTDNVLDLMVGKLNRLPPTTQAALKDLACLGNSADFTTLAIAHATTEEAVHLELWEALRMECIVRSGHSYKFVHDRIKEAAYSLVPEPSRAEAHLRIGRLLVARTTPEHREDAIFEIVNQLNRGTSLITSRDEREQLAAFNLVAGRRARASAAYASALTYLIAGGALLASDRWQRHHDLAFALELHRAECEFLTGALVAAETRLTMLVSRALNTIDRVAVESLRIDLYTALDQTDRVVASCLDYLRHLGIDWTPHPTEEEVRREYQQIWLQLGSRAIEDLAALPLMTDPQSLAIMDVLAKIYPTVTLTDANLLSLAVCRAINLSLERGNCDASCVAYAYFGKLSGPRFGNHNAGTQFGQLGYTLVAERGLGRFEARTCHWLAQFGLPWTQHVKTCRGMIWRAFQAATKVGDLNIAVYSLDNLNTNFLGAGDPLVEAERQAEKGLAFAKRTRFGHQIDVQATQLALIRTLRGLTYRFGCFDDGQYSEALVEQHFTPHPAVYWIRKLQARFFAGDYAAALDYAASAQPMLWTLDAMFESAEFHFYAALSHAACCTSAVSHQRRSAPPRAVADAHPSSQPTEYSRHLDALATHHRQLDEWALHCPENFENRTALVAAEIARIEGQHLDAEYFYEHAILSARTNGFVHNEALANELAGRFYLARGLGKIAHAYLKDARYCYLQWGADGKVRQLDEFYPQLAKGEAPPGLTSTINAPIDHLDLATVIKVSQTVSSEIVLEALIETILRTAVEQAGAERGALVVSRGGELRCVAEAWTRPTTITVELRDEPIAGSMLPQSVVHYVVRTGEVVILDDGAASPTFSADPYIRQRQARSILCLPLLTQTKFGGLLYLENSLTPRVFVPGRTAVLKLLASQAAIALENASLYRDVAEREARIRRLVDANIIGTFIWKTKGPRDQPDDILIIEANDAFLRIVGYDREDLAAGRLSRSTLTPAEWCVRDAQNMAEARMNRTVLPFEKEYLRKDGSRAPVLLGFAAFDEQLDQGVAFVVDLTERKRAEVEAREVQMELAHANRVAAIGQLSASIGHEISQPLSGVITNAETGLLWLQTGPPNVQEAVAAFSRVVRDGKRAAAIVNRIRALVKKAPPQKDLVHINEAIHEVVDLTQSEAAKNSVLVQTHLGERLPPTRGDRVQLQQVILNLVVNAVEAIRSSDAEPREILIETARTGSDDILVSVRDTGPGPDPENIERMFDAFYSTKALGLGLGLSICRSIIEAHGGTLWATPGAPQGAVFQFTLPGEQSDRVTH